MRSFHTLMIKVKMLGYKNLPLSSSFDWWLTFLLVGWVRVIKIDYKLNVITIKV